MRRVGECERKELAERFRSYLLSLDIANEIRESGARWGVWVHSEDDVARATREFAEFEKTPDADRYLVLPQTLAAKPALPDRSSGGAALDAGRIWTLGRTGIAPLTFSLVAASVTVTVWSWLGAGPLVERYVHCNLEKLVAGEIWRAFTPAFLHYGILHLLFNMMWLQHLGRMIERIKGVGFLSVLVLATAAVSNLLQAFLSGPHFGGMSGVVYGLFGYIWMKSRFQPFEGLMLDDGTILLMIAWFGLCLTGVVGPIANWAHAAGLVMGVAFGIAPTLRQTLTKKRT